MNIRKSNMASILLHLQKIEFSKFAYIMKTASITNFLDKPDNLPIATTSDCIPVELLKAIF